MDMYFNYWIAHSYVCSKHFFSFILHSTSLPHIYHLVPCIVVYRASVHWMVALPELDINPNLGSM